MMTDGGMKPGHTHTGMHTHLQPLWSASMLGFECELSPSKLVYVNTWSPDGSSLERLWNVLDMEPS